MRRLRLFRDVLDSQMIDVLGRESGKVDGIVAQLRDGAPPLLVAVENGLPEQARRVSERVGDWIAALGRRWGVRHGEVYRIPWSRVRLTGINVQLDLDVTKTPLFAWEAWVREHIVAKIPRSGI